MLCGSRQVFDTVKVLVGSPESPASSLSWSCRRLMPEQQRRSTC